MMIATHTAPAAPPPLSFEAFMAAWLREACRLDNLERHWNEMPEVDRAAAIAGLPAMGDVHAEHGRQVFTDPRMYLKGRMWRGLPASASSPAPDPATAPDDRSPSPAPLP